MRYQVSIPTEKHVTRSRSATAVAYEAQILDHMPLVRTLAKHLHRSLPQHVELEDLVSAGSVGLIEALHRFDPLGPTSLKTFASSRIRGAMLDSLRKLGWGARDLRRRGREIEEATRSCMAALGRNPEEEDIATELGITLREFQRVRSELHAITLGSLKTVHADANADADIEVSIKSSDPGALAYVLQAELQASVAKCLDELAADERRVISFCFYDELNNAEVAALLGRSESRVGRLKATAISRLRAALAPLGETT